MQSMIKNRYALTTITYLALLQPEISLKIFILYFGFQMLLIEYLNRPNDNREVYFLGMRIPNWIYNVYCMIGMFAFGAACSQLTTDVMKYTIGRLRPHFITVCQPDVCNSSYTTHMLVYHEEFKCTNPLYIDNERILKEMR